MNSKKISELFLSIISEFFENDKKARKFGTDTELYHSEIHMIKCIKENSNMHISAIARHLNITRGAVSQTIKRLESKNFLTKEVDVNNNSRVILKLTHKGETAYRFHEKYHEEYNAKILEILKDADKDHIEFLYDFLLKFEKNI